MQATSDASLRYIQKLQLFEGLKEREKSILAGVFKPRGLVAGEVLCREGDPARSFFVIASGSIEIYKELAEGRREFLVTVGPNTILGQVSLIDRGARSATLKAASSTMVLECGVDDFDRLFNAGTPFAYKLMDKIVTELARGVREADQELFVLFSNPKKTLMRLHEAALDVQRAAVSRGT